MTNSIYEVSRAEYNSFVKQIRPEAREIKIEDLNETQRLTSIYSKNTGKQLCGRVNYTGDDEEYSFPEKYYIFELPEADESLPPIPTRRIVLKTKEEVQAVLDYISKMQKEQDNG